VTRYRPASNVHPGIVLNEEMEKRGWTLDEIAERTAISVSVWRGLVERRESITPKLATALSEVIGTTDRFWLNLQRGYDEYQYEPEWTPRGCARGEK